MSRQLNWIVDPRPTAFHAAAAIHAGFPLTDPSLATTIAPAVITLGKLAAQEGFSTASLWQHLIPLSAHEEGLTQLSEAVVRKLMGRADRAALLASQLQHAMQVVDEGSRTALPNLHDELGLRVGPIRQQWEARGPGMLHRVAKITAESPRNSPVDVLLVHPVLGGHGDVHPPYQAVRFEAVLANPYPQVPEIVRLAWLLTRLDCRPGPLTAVIDGERFTDASVLAAVPLVLSAAAELELCPFNSSSLAEAVQAWRLGGTRPEVLARIAGDWWQAFQQTRPAWHEAVAALDNMLVAALPSG